MWMIASHRSYNKKIEEKGQKKNHCCDFYSRMLKKVKTMSRKQTGLAEHKMLGNMSENEP
jgi:hypothetical protein